MLRFATKKRTQQSERNQDILYSLISCMINFAVDSFIVE